MLYRVAGKIKFSILALVLGMFLMGKYKKRGGKSPAGYGSVLDNRSRWDERSEAVFTDENQYSK